MDPKRSIRTTPDKVFMATYAYNGATTTSITTLNITAVGIMTHRMITVGITSFCVTKWRYDNQHNDT
jgi:hypothetical protein